MPLSDFVNTELSSTGPSVTEEGFGTPLILAADCPEGFVERVRVYNKPADMVDDGFDSGSGAYRQASRLCSQSPRPPTFKIGRLEGIPTQSWTLTPIASDQTTYAVEVDGVLASITSGDSATAAEIVTALKTAIGTPDDITLGGTDNLTITAGTPGAFHTVKVAPKMTTRFTVAQDHADPGVTDDLDAILLEDSDFYAVLNQFNSAAVAGAIADWCETNKKLFLCASQDSEIINHALTDATDLAASVKSDSDFYTHVDYCASTDDFLDAAQAGKKLTATPGSEIWLLTSMAGVPALKLTATQRTNLLAKYAGFYEGNVAGKNISVGGKVGSGEWIDVVRGKDWLTNHIDSLVFEAETAAAETNSKIPFTDPGIAVIQGAIKTALKDGVKATLLAADPAPAVQVPLVKDVSSIDKGQRKLTTVTFTATLAGAIVAVDPIIGTLTV